jgi:hypothetical protein
MQDFAIGNDCRNQFALFAGSGRVCQSTVQVHIAV